MLVGILGNSMHSGTTEGDSWLLTSLIHSPDDPMAAILNDQRRAEELRAMGERVRLLSATIDLRCGGRPMVSPDCTERADESIDASHRTGTQLGKRYADSETGLEVLCTKPGEGSLSLGDVAIPMKDPKPLPASD